MTKHDDGKFSRRGALASGLRFVALAGTAASTPALAQSGKLPQKIVHYQDKPKDGHHCSICAHFQTPHSCDIVQGNIDPNGWCLRFSPKVSY